MADAYNLYYKITDFVKVEKLLSHRSFLMTNQVCIPTGEDS